MTCPRSTEHWQSDAIPSRYTQSRLTRLPKRNQDDFVFSLQTEVQSDYKEGGFERLRRLSPNSTLEVQPRLHPAEPVTALQMARVKRSPSSPPRSSVDPTATRLGSKSTPRRTSRTAVNTHDDQQDELDCLPVIETCSSSPAKQHLAPLRPLKVPNKLQTPSASPHSRPLYQPIAPSRRNNDLLDVPDRTRTRGGRKSSPVRDRHQQDRNPGSVARPTSEQYSYAEMRESALAERRMPAKRSRPGPGKQCPVPSSSRSPSRSALSPERSIAGERTTPTSSARKRSQRASSGLTFKPPAPSALTEDRDYRAAQRARLQEQRIRALAKRRRVEQVDEDEEEEEDEEGGACSDTTSVDDEEEGRRSQNATRRADRRTQVVAAAERSTRSGHARAPTQQASRLSPRPPKRIKPDPDETSEFIAGSSSHPPNGLSLPQPAAPPPPPSATTTTAVPIPPPPLRHYPTPPTASAFLTTLPLPSLARLVPHFHGLGCTSPGELLVLCDPAQRPLREEFLKEVADKAGGVSALERMMLHREMDCGWMRWTGAIESGVAEEGVRVGAGGPSFAGTVA